MTNSQRSACHAAIHTASAACAAVGAGLAQLPCSDNAVITPIQLTMAVSLAKVFGLELEDGAAKAAVASAIASVAGRSLSQLFIGWMPGIGNVVNAVTAASLTESIGWLMAGEFERRAEYAA